MMPSRPTTPSPKKWAAATPNANLVRQQYVNARVHELARTQDSLEEKTIELLSHEPTLAAQVKGKTSDEKRKFFEQIYYRLTYSLQQYPLTINFIGYSWFSKENNSETYGQCYERAMDQKTGRMALRQGLAKRAGVDDVVTFPQAWETKPELKRTGPGLMPGAQQSGNSILQYMKAGRTVNKSDLHERGFWKRDAAFEANLQETSPGSKQFDSPNKSFNPKTKQVFAALNYGYRPHGAVVQYGQDHIVLDDRFKVDALYYPHDTYDFDACLDQQVSYDMLGVIYLKAKVDMRQQLLQTCINNMRLTDNTANNANLLLEAHLFADVRFREDVTEMVVTFDGKPLENAKRFCDKNSIRLVQS